MKQTSKVKGVHWSPAREEWISRTPGKKVLYRGLDQKLAETLRLEYDAAQKRQIQAKPRKHKERYKSARFIDWPPTKADFGLEQSYEI